MENTDSLDIYLCYLDDLRESGVVNMSGAALYLRDEFPELSRDRAREIRTHWMQTFSERQRQLKEHNGTGDRTH